MVNHQSLRLDATFAALADPTRRAILTRLGARESSVTELARPFRISLPAISKHLGVLERAGLIQRRRQGRMHRCRLVAHPMRQAAAWLGRYRRFWEHQFDQLAAFLEETPEVQENPAWLPLPRRPPSRSGSRAGSRRRRAKSSRPGRSRKA